jgi:glycerol-3-phosphate acyltransferase PlsY
VESLWFTLGAGLFGYLLGSVPSGYIIGQREGVDIRQYGSKNIGATNVLRTLGPKTAAVVFVMDVAKGAIPVLAALLLGGSVWAQLAAATGALAGHTWPFTLRFKGGRAVATSFGVTAVLAPWAALCALVLFALIVGTTRYVSLGSILASVIAVALFPVFHVSLPVSVFGVLVAALIVIRHRPNIERLLAGKEAKIGQRVAIPGRESEQQRKAK